MALLNCALVLVVFGALNAAFTPNYMLGGLLPIPENSYAVEVCKEMILKYHQDQLKKVNGPYYVKVTLEVVKAESQLVSGLLYYLEYKTKTTYTCKKGATCVKKEPEVKDCTAVIFNDFIDMKGFSFETAPACL